MIACIHGKLIHKEPTYLVIDVGGLGYEVRISLNTFTTIKNEERCMLYTHLDIKENAHTLYGFSHTEEKACFTALIRVKSVGPSIALAILSALTPKALKEAIMREEVHTLKAVKGVGQKTAQLIILELKESMGNLELTGPTLSSGPQGVRQEALAALTRLGVSKALAEKAIHIVLQTQPAGISVEQLVRLALQAT